jgi:hypothetical protein
MSASDFKGPGAWSKFLKNEFYAAGKSSKVPKKGSEEYIAIKAKYTKWQSDGLASIGIVPVAEVPANALTTFAASTATEPIVNSAELVIKAVKKARASRARKVVASEPLTLIPVVVNSESAKASETAIKEQVKPEKKKRAPRKRPAPVETQPRADNLEVVDAA